MASSVFGVIAPHPPILVQAVGGAERHKADASLLALQEAADAIAVFEPETLILMSPHAPTVYDTFLVDTAEVMSGSLSDFGDTHTASRKVDVALARALVKAADQAGIPIAPRDADSRLRSGWLDHASLVPLSFLDPKSRYRIVVLSLSFLSLATHHDLGRVIRQTAETLGRKVVFIASGDCSHRLLPESGAGYSPRGQEFDDALVESVREGRLGELRGIDPALSEAAGECGLRSFVTLGGFAGEDQVPTRVLAYEGPWGVGYLTALVGEAALASVEGSRVRASDAEGPVGESEIVALARATLRAALAGSAPPAPVLVSPEYPVRAGAFVSLHREGRLRGCIGTISPTQPTLAEEVAHNSLAAAFDDPRFPALSSDELDDLEMSVDVLHPAEPTSIEGLDPSCYGVIVAAGFRRGLLLPDLDGIDDAAIQLEIALQKAGIRPEEEFTIERFRVDRFR